MFLFDKIINIQLSKNNIQQVAHEVFNIRHSLTTSTVSFNSGQDTLMTLAIGWLTPAFYTNGITIYNVLMSYIASDILGSINCISPFLGLLNLNHRKDFSLSRWIWSFQRTRCSYGVYSPRYVRLLRNTVHPRYVRLLGVRHMCCTHPRYVRLLGVLCVFVCVCSSFVWFYCINVRVILSTLFLKKIIRQTRKASCFKGFQR